MHIFFLNWRIFKIQQPGLAVSQDFLTQPDPLSLLIFWPNPTQPILSFSEIDPTLPIIDFLEINPTWPILIKKNLTQPNPTHFNFKKFDPTHLKPKKSDPNPTHNGSTQPASSQLIKWQNPIILEKLRKAVLNQPATYAQKWWKRDWSCVCLGTFYLTTLHIAT